MTERRRHRLQCDSNPGRNVGQTISIHLHCQLQEASSIWLLSSLPSLKACCALWLRYFGSLGGVGLGLGRTGQEFRLRNMIVTISTVSMHAHSSLQQPNGASKSPWGLRMFTLWSKVIFETLIYDHPQELNAGDYLACVRPPHPCMMLRKENQLIYTQRMGGG